MAIFIDRRKNQQGKSTSNRQRFLRRIKAIIKVKAHEIIGAGASTGAQSKDNNVVISKKSIVEPRFSYGQSNLRIIVLPGNYKYVKGDELDMEELMKKGNGKGKGSGPGGEGEDDFVVNVSRDEFLDYFFEDLELPNMEKTMDTKIADVTNKPAGFVKEGTPAKLALLPSIRNAKMRKRALEAPWRKKIKLVEEEIVKTEGLAMEYLFVNGEQSEELETQLENLKKELTKYRIRIAAIPFVDLVDLRYRATVKIPIKRSSAAIFFIMDNSGSMGQEEKTLSRKFFTLLYLFVTRRYETVDVIFISHTDKAHEVDEETFFTTRESGGTIVSTALKLMKELYDLRYAGSNTNVYVCQSSDGDNWADDNNLCQKLLISEILPVVQHYAYVQVEPNSSHRTDSGLLNMFSELKKKQVKKLDCKRIKTPDDIYPAFREFFKKETVVQDV